jgi:hypothetical protein
MYFNLLIYFFESDISNLNKLQNGNYFKASFIVIVKIIILLLLLFKFPYYILYSIFLV